ncbi:DNA primase [Haloplanus aerogenes]|nr:DNA primase [Haloplanus aerogenes]RMB13010.1 hypothetical protein ATH50_3168 [Haloplanus aerogenes]
MAALLLVSAVAPAAVTAQTTDESLSLDVTQDETGAVTVTLTDNGTAVENATVNVTADGNDTYAGAGEYETDTNGTVSLEAPDEPVTVTVEASYNGTTTTQTVDLEPALGIEVDGAADGSVVVTVTRGNATVEDATVNVTANTTYADTGEFETDENGTVTLANPDETVELTITAMDGNDTASTSVVVKPVQTLAVGVEQADDGTVTVSVGRLGEPVTNATVTVTTDGTYAATGEYETDDTGTVVLPAPAENVTVTVTATKEGDTATTTADLEPPEPVGPFGQIVSAFVDALKGAGFTGIGQQVSDFVTGNNPSNAGNSEAVGNNAPVTPPAAGNNAPVTPPGQEKKDGNQSRIVPANPPVENKGNESAPGNSGSAPGQSDDDEDESPGNSGSAPGQSGDDAEDESDESPGNSGSAPGQSEDSDDDQSEDESDESPGNSDSAPGQSEDSDDDQSEDESDESPGNSDSAPGQSDEEDEQDGGNDDAGDNDAGSSGNDDAGGGSDNAGGNSGGGNAGGNSGGGNAGGNSGGGNAGGNGGGNGNGR